MLLVWIMLLVMAGKRNAGGMVYITETVPYTDEDLAEELRFEVNTIRLAMKAFEEFEMISTKSGFIKITGWEEYQNEDKLAEMRAKDRDRKRLKRAQARGELPSVFTESADVRRQSEDSPCIEEEEEKEKEKEKEIHSIIHSTPEQKRHYLGGIGKGVVLLSDEQMGDLLDKLSIEEFDYYVGVVAENELKGHHYKKKTHYQAILEMVGKDRKVKG